MTSTCDAVSARVVWLHDNFEWLYKPLFLPIGKPYKHHICKAFLNIKFLPISIHPISGDQARLFHLLPALLTPALLFY